MSKNRDIGALPTIARLKEVLAYDAETGHLTWTSRVRKDHAGQRAGGLKWDGYRRLKLDRCELAEHRVAWALFYGDWPKEQIDHIDGGRSNNAIANLREASPSENQQNVRSERKNSSGHIGVCWNSKQGKWQAQIKKDGRLTYLGLRNDLEDACALYREAKIQFHSFCPHLRS